MFLGLMDTIWTLLGTEVLLRYYRPTVSQKITNQEEGSSLKISLDSLNMSETSLQFSVPTVYLQQHKPSHAVISLRCPLCILTR